MPTKIKYKNFFALKELCQDVLHEYSEQIDGYPYDEEKLNALYSTDWYSGFEKEFNKNVVNTTDNVALQRYFNEIYYNGVIYFCVRFKNLARYYEFKKGFKDRTELVKDDLFLIIYNHYYYSLSLLAETIRMKGIELNINLKPHFSITIDDYNISSRYMELYNHQNNLEEELNQQPSQPEKVVGIQQSKKGQSYQPQEIFENQSLQPENKHQKVQAKQPLKNKSLIDFFKEDKKKLAEEVILPYIKENYKKAKGKELAVLWIALLKIQYVDPIRHGDKKKIFFALHDFLEGDLGRQEWFSNELKNQEHPQNGEVKKVEKKINEIVQDFKKTKK